MDAMAMEVRHGCKVCWKSFSSGRSLGGHMRSHLSLGEAAAEGDAAAAALVRASANGVRSSRGVVEYGLRENPRKTRRLSDFAADDDDENGGDGDGDGDGEHKVCRECGKLFASWSSLFGHMRSHASGVRDRDGDEDVGMEEEFVPEEVEAKEAEMVAAAMEAPVLAQAAVTEPRRRRRTMRVAAPPPAPSPVLYGFEKEQEDVALCLLMLSRDTALWSSPAKEAPPLGNAKKKKQTGLLRGGNAYNPDDDSALLQHGDAKIKGRRRSSPKQQRDAAEPKRTRYECPGCGKVFSSYQALGGHRASHKRINTSCSAAKEAPGAAGTAASPAPEPSTETYASCSTLPPSASPDSVVSGFARSKAQAVAEAAVEKFECQEALGGHGLSHLMPADDGELYAGGAGQELEQHSAAAAGFLDLNFPLAPPEEA